MPTNLPPECAELQRRFREAETASEKISILEELLGAIPKHKGTEHLRADYKTKLSKLKAEGQQHKGVARHETAFRLEREGAGQVVVVGCTNVGKSALVRALTHAVPEVSAAPFTTWEPLPGMMMFGKVPIQLVDTPPLDREFIEPGLMDLIRRADLILLMIDLLGEPFEQLQHTVDLLAEHRIIPKHQQSQYSEEQRLNFVPLIVLVNKCDDQRCEEDYQAFHDLLEEEWPLLPISVNSGHNLERLKEMAFEQLGVIRVYSKAPGKGADLNVPFVVKKGTTVEELAGKIHKDLLKHLKSARVWGSGAFDGQMVAREYVLQDNDIVELRA